MGLKEEMEETRKQLAQAQDVEEKEQADAEVEKPAEKVDAPVSDPEPAKEEPVKEEAKPEEPQHPAQARIAKKKQVEAERDADRAELAAARARIAELERVAQPKAADSDPAPNKDEDPTAWLAWKERKIDQKLETVERKTAAIERQEAAKQTKDSALAEVAAYESQVRSVAPDYDAAKNYYANFEAYLIKRDNPNMTPAALNEAVTLKMMRRLAHFQTEGYENPVAAMYDEAKTLGYRPVQAAEAVEDKKPDLARVAKNRDRNGGMAAAGGKSGSDADPTPAYVATQMTVAQANKHFKGMTADQKQQWYKQMEGR